MTKGRARDWTPMDDEVLRALHAAGRSSKYIATFMCCATCTVQRHANTIGLVFDQKHHWTPAEDALLRARYPNEPAKDIARDLGLQIGQVYQHARMLGLAKSEAFLASDKAGRIVRGRTDPRLVAGQFKKGLIPANKGIRRPGWAPGRMAETQFKKGRPASEARNYVSIGTEKIDRKRNVLMRKVTDDPSIFPANRWRPVHVLVWESHHGQIPAGHICVFKPGQKSFKAAEITIDRLEVVSLAENMRRNTIHVRLPSDLKQIVQLTGALKRKINNRSRQA